jgi:hypothetical protein
VQKPALRNPPSPLDQFLVHDRNLTGWTAKADKAKLQPKKKRFAKRNRLWHSAQLIIRLRVGADHADIPRQKNRSQARQRGKPPKNRATG